MACSKLPVELRWQIYEDYLSALFNGPSEIYYFPSQTNNTPEIPIMRLNHQAYSDMTDFLLTHNTLLYQITSQYEGFDPLAPLSFKARKHRPTFSKIKHLALEIHPPHPDRPTDMFRIWRRAQRLCDDLRATKQVCHLSVRFMEDDIAAWSTNGIPHRTMGVST